MEPQQQLIEYSEQLSALQSAIDVDADSAFSYIETIAQEIGDSELLAKLRTGEVMSMVNVSYGKQDINRAASLAGISLTSAREYRQLVEFYNGFNACALFCIERPILRYSHLRIAMRYALKHGEGMEYAMDKLDAANDLGLGVGAFENELNSDDDKPQSATLLDTEEFDAANSVVTVRCDPETITAINDLRKRGADVSLRIRAKWAVPLAL